MPIVGCLELTTAHAARSCAPCCWRCMCDCGSARCVVFCAGMTRACLSARVVRQRTPSGPLSMPRSVRALCCTVQSTACKQFSSALACHACPCKGYHGTSVQIGAQCLATSFGVYTPTHLPPPSGQWLRCGFTDGRTDGRTELWLQHACWALWLQIRVILKAYMSCPVLRCRRAVHCVSASPTLWARPSVVPHTVVSTRTLAMRLVSHQPRHTPARWVYGQC
jgi:hypothetical protein